LGGKQKVAKFEVLDLTHMRQNKNSQAAAGSGRPEQISLILRSEAGLLRVTVLLLFLFPKKK
jgi:IS4 transposase